jgi:hypothetical protein
MQYQVLLVAAEVLLGLGIWSHKFRCFSQDEGGGENLGSMCWSSALKYLQ